VPPCRDAARRVRPRRRSASEFARSASSSEIKSKKWPLLGTAGHLERSIYVNIPARSPVMWARKACGQGSTPPRKPSPPQIAPKSAVSSAQHESHEIPPTSPNEWGRWKSAMFVGAVCPQRPSWTPVQERPPPPFFGGPARIAKPKKTIGSGAAGNQNKNPDQNREPRTIPLKQQKNKNPQIFFFFFFFSLLFFLFFFFFFFFLFFPKPVFFGFYFFFLFFFFFLSKDRGPAALPPRKQGSPSAPRGARGPPLPKCA